MPEPKNARLLQRGDVVVDGDGNEVVVRGVSLIAHLANGRDIPVDIPSEVMLVTEEEVSEELAQQIEALDSAE